MVLRPSVQHYVGFLSSYLLSLQCSGFHSLHLTRSFIFSHMVRCLQASKHDRWGRTATSASPGQGGKEGGWQRQGWQGCSWRHARVPDHPGRQVLARDAARGAAGACVLTVTVTSCCDVVCVVVGFSPGVGHRSLAWRVLPDAAAQDARREPRFVRVSLFP